jgi:predicted Zn finger-like uncharacterized protein
MLIVCPSCATAYNVEAESLRPDGRQVRCVRCRAVWQAELSRSDKLLAAADAIGPPGADAAEASAPPPFAEAGEPRPAAELGAARVGDAEPVEQETDGASIQPGDSGSAPVEGQAAAGPPAEVADVEAPPIAPVDLDEGRPPVDIEPDRGMARQAAMRGDIESIAARRQPRGVRRRTARWPLSRLQTAILALLFVDVLLVGWRSDFVRALPQTASFYAAMGLPVNLRGLAFEGVATAAEQHEGVPILVVEGNVVNDARKTVEVPRLKFIIRNAARQEIYSWTAVPSRAALTPGEAVAFRTRLASPPPEARDVLVRFVTRRDIVGAIR